MLSQIAGKQAGYRAMAEFYQSLVCKNNKSIGEEIARLEVIAGSLELFILQIYAGFNNLRKRVNTFSMLWSCSKPLSRDRISRICSKITPTGHREI